MLTKCVSAPHNSRFAQMKVGVGYGYGRGSKREDEKAVQMFTAAAQRGCPEAMRRLGGMHMRGEGGLKCDVGKL